MFAFCVLYLLTTKLSIWFQTRGRHRKQINALCPSFTSLRPIIFKLHVATEANDDHYHLFTDILLVKTEEAQLTTEIVMVIAPLTATLG